MDGLIKRFDSVKDRDLRVCEARGVAYQRDMGARQPPGINAEGQNYFDHYAALDGHEIGRKLNAGRVALVNQHVGSDCLVLDVGVGSGDFIKARPNTLGIDVNPKAMEWLKEQGRAAKGLDGYPAYTFWDVLEHIEDPNECFRRMPDNCHLFTSLPIFKDLKHVRASRHYKPGEHLYYFTERGFEDWMAAYRFRLIERSTFETEAGRDGITSFAFKRDLPTYHQTVDQYRRLYEPNYGASAYLYFDEIAREVLTLNPASVLDFGCGRSDLVAHFWNDGARRVAKYDPAINQFKQMPEGAFDLVLCTDVMEHIMLPDVERIFREIRRAGARALFTISTKPARAKLPDGRNAHVTLLTPAEWLRWIADVFDEAVRVPYRDEQILMVKTW